MPTDDKLLHVMLRVLDTDKRIQDVVAEQRQITMRISHMEQLVRLSWRPTEPQEVSSH